MHIKFVHKTFSFRKQLSTIKREEIRTAVFCTEVFVMSKNI